MRDIRWVLTRNFSHEPSLTRSSIGTKVTRCGNKVKVNEFPPRLIATSSKEATILRDNILAQFGEIVEGEQLQNFH